MAAFSHNGEPGSALDAELKGRDTRHMEGYSAGYQAGREAGLREAAQISAMFGDCANPLTNSHKTMVHLTASEIERAILSAIGGDK